MKQENIKYKMIDLFAGCGGLSCGLEQAGFTPWFVNEIVLVVMSHASFHSNPSWSMRILMSSGMHIVGCVSLIWIWT